MTKTTCCILAALAVLATTASADARNRHRHYTKAPAEAAQGYQQQQYMRAAPLQENFYFGRRDPSTWSGHLNAWDKARRDDSLLSEH